MPAKHSETLTTAGWKITAAQKKIIDAEAFARRYGSSSELVRDIFQSWIEEHHNPATKSL